MNYLYGLPTWAVSIAAERDGETVVGSWRPRCAARPTARCSAAARTANDKPVRCRPAPPLDQALVATGFNYVATVRSHQADVAQRLIPRLRDIRRGGSAAIDLCDVAAGRLDGYYERGLNPWDLAAGDLIAREAGALTGGRPGQPAVGRPDGRRDARASSSRSRRCWTSSAPGTTEADCTPKPPARRRRAAASGSSEGPGTVRGAGALLVGGSAALAGADLHAVLGGEAVQVLQLGLLDIREEVVARLAGRVRSVSVVFMRCRSPAVNASMVRPLVVGRWHGGVPTAGCDHGRASLERSGRGDATYRA